MQLLPGASKRSISDDACARDLLDVVPLVIKVIRQHMRSHRAGLTMAQFRTLCFVSTAEGSSLSAAADFIGLSLPAMSRLVDGLVEQRLMERKTCSDDRRHVRLSVTRSGDTAIKGARARAQAELAKAVKDLTPRQRAALVDTMQVLREVFTPELAGADAEASVGVTDAVDCGNSSH